MLKKKSLLGRSVVGLSSGSNTNGPHVGGNVHPVNQVPRRCFDQRSTTSNVPRIEGRHRW